MLSSTPQLPATASQDRPNFTVREGMFVDEVCDRIQGPEPPT